MFEIPANFNWRGLKDGVGNTVTIFQLSHLHPAARQFCRSTYTITDITIK
jgi:hypothetical protein